MCEKSESNSITDESEKLELRQKVKNFIYPSIPHRNDSLRSRDHIVPIATNLFSINFTDKRRKLFIYNMSILPELANDNESLKRQIRNNFSPLLPKSMKKIVFFGNNLICFVDDLDKSHDCINLEVNVDNQNYKVKITKVGDLFLKDVNNFDGKNKKIKSVIENIFRNAVLKNTNVITFHDRTIFEIDPKNVASIKEGDPANIYRGYVTACHITDNGLYMLINNRNKLISGKTVLKKMIELKNKYSNLDATERNREISDYFKIHKTVLTIYSLRAYKIEEILFDRSPSTQVIQMRDINGTFKSIPLINYYEKQYNIKIKNLNQPLLKVERADQKTKKENRKLLPPGEQNNQQNQNTQENVIYLVPELVYLTGLEDDNPNKSRKDRSSISFKTKLNPTQKMQTINGFFDLVNSDKHKQVKLRDGTIKSLKSSKEIIEEWGINIGENLSFKARVFSQPHVIFQNNKNVVPNNGIFRADNPCDTHEITNDNIFYLYESREKDRDRKFIDHKHLFADILSRSRKKNFKFGKGFNPNNVRGFSIEDVDNWNSVNKFLLKNKEQFKNKKIGVIFLSNRLDRFYGQFKSFFINQFGDPIVTQCIQTKNLTDPKRANSIMFNLVDQINIKMGGTNYYIDFYKESIIECTKNNVYLIIGLDSKKEKKNVCFNMTSTTNSHLNKCIYLSKQCKNVKDAVDNCLSEMFEIALRRNNAPKSPDYIILYRKGGNEPQNKTLVISEKDIFINKLKEFKENYKDSQHNFQNTKFYYICVNLKSDLKFFEVGREKNTYFNPKSGLVIDENVTQKDKYEFYIQPQFVNQGTATPCHYQVMYYDKDEHNTENDLKIENLQKLSFYLSFYYWTWSGAIREPGALKMAGTLSDFTRNVLKNNIPHDGLFTTPLFV